MVFLPQPAGEAACPPPDAAGANEIGPVPASGRIPAAGQFFHTRGRVRQIVWERSTPITGENDSPAGGLQSPHCVL
jgi:hypothetical protein